MSPPRLVPPRLVASRLVPPRLALAAAAAASLSALAATSPALAARPTEASRATVAQAITDCRRIADKDARLDCYDKAADAFDQAQAQGQVVVIDRAQAQQVKREAFGFHLPSINLFKAGPKDQPLDKVEVTLASARQDATGKWVMTTDDGAVWQQIDDTQPYHEPHAGSRMVIRNALLGSFFCKADNDAAMRCSRVR